MGIGRNGGKAEGLTLRKTNKPHLQDHLESTHRDIFPLFSLSVSLCIDNNLDTFREKREVGREGGRKRERVGRIRLMQINRWYSTDVFQKKRAETCGDGSLQLSP